MARTSFSPCRGRQSGWVAVARSAHHSASRPSAASVRSADGTRSSPPTNTWLSDSSCSYTRAPTPASCRARASASPPKPAPIIATRRPHTSRASSRIAAAAAFAGESGRGI
eukprot:scaffold15017_cov64-Phaeocystis_antarctica.AAC.3